MKRPYTILGLFVVFQVVFGDELPEEPDARSIIVDPHHGPLIHPYQERIPRHCWRPPRGVSTYACCPIPRMYPDDILDACGIEEQPEPTEGVASPPPKSRKLSDEEKCEKGHCLMRKSNLLKEDDSVDYDKVRVYINKWADAHPNFTEAILIARDLCVVEGGPFRSHPSRYPKVCEADQMFFCLTAQILWNCNLREDMDSCKVLKAHMAECKQYYMKPKDEDEIKE